MKVSDAMTTRNHRIEVSSLHNESEVQDGGRVAEVVAMYNDTVLDVQHLGQTRDGRRSAPRWLAAGGALVLGGLALFGHDAAQDWDGHAEAVKAAAEVSAPAPKAPGTGLGGLGFGLAMLGLIPFGVAAMRMQDRARTAYTLGEGHDAAFHVAVPGRRELPIVQGERDHNLQFTADMAGEVRIGDTHVTLEELIRNGLARQVEAGVYSYPLAAGAKARIRWQGLTFFIHSVAPGRVIARKSEIDKPFWFHNGLSAAAIGSLILLTQMIPNEAGALALQEELGDSRFVGYLAQPNEQKDEAIPTDEEQADEPGGAAGERHVGDEGKAGKKESKQVSGRYAIKGNASAVPKLARNFDPDMDARNTGVLGLMKADSGHFMASPFGDTFAVGNDNDDVWGQLVGKDIAESNGFGGLGLVGTGRSGGGTGEGTVGLTSVGLIGHNRPGDGEGGLLRRSAGFETRKTRSPQVLATKAEVVGGLDKDLIRRVVRAHINEVRYCYNQGLAKDANLKGRVAVQFTIGGTGKVTSAVVGETDLKDRAVGSCIAQAVKRWSFPKPASGGAAIVTYPFILQPG
jgi:TonB family protein